MFALIYIPCEQIHDVCKLTAIKLSDEQGPYILRNGEKLRVNLICSNENEKILAEIKYQNNSKLPEVVMEQAQNDREKLQANCEYVTDTPSCSVKRRLFAGEDDDITRISDVENDPYSTDDSYEDHNFNVSSSKYVLSSDENESPAKQQSIQKNVKKNCCVFCKTLFSKITPHLERRHSDESEVKKFMALSKGNPARKHIIDTLRKQGNFLYSEENGIKISVRRTQTETKKICPNCKGFFSTKSIRKHYRRCQPNGLQGRRGLLVMSRKLQLDIHPNACNVLRKEIFPVLREDSVTNAIRFDELIITYANRLCQKYTSKHLHKMIRARLRLVGRFLEEMRKKEKEVTEFTSVFHPKFFDSTIKCINVVAQFNEESSKYKSPATALSLGSILKFVANVLISECIKRQDVVKKNEVEDYLKLLHTELATAVNKTVSENQLEFKRQKKIVLPSNDDIKKLFNYLTCQRRLFFEKCKHDFSNHAWVQLAGLTLISMQLFNRRRAGELERIFIEDFRSHHGIDEHDDLFKALSSESQKAAKKYVRFTIRGKLARGVPVLLTKEILDCLELLLEKRSDVGVPTENPFVFGIPHRYFTHKHLDAYSLLVDFSLKCNADKPETLRGTGLRKHIATQCIQLELKENEVKDLANYLGHAEKIHMDHYRMPVAARDITIMSRLLEKAQGTDNLENQEESLCEERTERNEQLSDVTPGPSSLKPSTPTKATPVSSDQESVDNVRHVKSTPEKKKKIVRTAWITPERQAIKACFLSHIKSGTLPSFNECRKAKDKYPALQRRSLAVIKTHVSNEINRRK